jgi:glutamate synthase domain-containing protein 2
MPMRDGLLFVNSALRGVGLRSRIRVIGAGKISSGFHMIRAIALGADLCNSARAMMFALGCIQARRCNANDCPVGVATQDPGRYQGLVVKDKAPRVQRYHRDTIRAFLELIASNGLSKPDQIEPRNVHRRVSATSIRTFADVYEYLPEGCLLEESGMPDAWRDRWNRASAERFGTAPWRQQG